MELLQQRCELFITNKKILQKTFKLETEEIYAACAAIYTARGIEVDNDDLKKCKKLIEESKGVFSSFRGCMQLASAALLAVSNKPKELFKQVCEIYDLLKEYFSGSEYLVQAAFILAENAYDGDLDDICKRAKKLYKKMKREHPFLTGSEDSVFAITLAMSERDDKELIEDMESCYNDLRKGFGNNAVQTVSHILALTDGESERKASKFRGLYDGLAKAGRKFGKDYELPVLAGLSATGISNDRIVADVLFADEFLDDQKGYGGLFGTNKTTRLMHAALIVSGCYGSRGSHIANIASAAAIIAAEQAMMAAIIASSAAASAAASS